MRLSVRRHCCCRRRRRYIVVVVTGTACLTAPATKRYQQPFQRGRRPVSGEEGKRPTGAFAGAGCLTAPAAKRYQQPFQRGRRPVSGEEGKRPARAVAGTGCLTVPAAKRKQLPFQRLRQPMSGERGERPAGAFAGTACQTVPLLRDIISRFNGGGDRGAGREMNGRRLRCYRRWQGWVVTAGAAAGISRLAVPGVTRRQQPWQRRR